MTGNLGFGAVASASVAGNASTVTSRFSPVGNLGFGAVASGSVAGSTSVSASAPIINVAGDLGFGAVASTSVAGNRSPSTVLSPFSTPTVVAAASATTAQNASFIAAGSGGPIRATQVVMEVLMPVTETARVKPFVWINT